MTTSTNQLIFNSNFWITETNSLHIRNSFTKILDESGLNVITFIEHFFQPEGYTCVWLLAESHLAIHTFPNFNKSYVELSSCSESKAQVFKQKSLSNFNII